MKQCSKCKQYLDKSKFNKKAVSKDGLDYICRDCARKKYKKYYAENVVYERERTYTRRIKNRSINQGYIFEYLREHPCVDCGQNDPLVLDFDHLYDKTYNVSYMSAFGYSIESMKEEIKKCEIRCCNCHRRKTLKESNAARYRYFHSQDV
jgi:hypothetical protein